MNIVIYLMLLGLALIFVFLGYLLKDDAQIFKFIGFSFLFLLSVIIIPGTPGSLEYTTGTAIVETPSGYTTTDTYSTYEDLTIGFFLALASIFGFINAFFTLNGGGFGQND